MYQPSTPPPMTPHSGRTALIYGVVAGLGLGIVESGIIVYLARNTFYNSFSVMSLPFGLLLSVIVFLLIGALAAKRMGKIVTGTLAGLWAGMIGGLIAAVTFFATLLAASSYYYGYSMLASSLTFIIVLVLAALGLGAGLGTLGGLIGQSFSVNTHTISPRYQQSDPPQPYYRQSVPSQQELEQVQYNQNNAPQRELQD